MQAAATKEEARPRFATDKNILHHRQVRHQVEFLIDDGNPQHLRMMGILDLDGAPLKVDLALVDAIDAGEDLHEGRFAGAILADQPQYFAGMHLQADIIQRLHAWKRFVDLFHPQQRTLCR